jgi:soluble lytic murein transglycosylase
MSLVVALAGCCGYGVTHTQHVGLVPAQRSTQVEAQPITRPHRATVPPRGQQAEHISPIESEAPIRAIRQAFERGAYQAVAGTIDAENAAFRARSEVRLARARAAFELGDLMRARAELKLIVDPHLAFAVNDLRSELAWASPSPGEVQLELGERDDRESLLVRGLATCQISPPNTCLHTLGVWLNRPGKERERRDLELRARTERLKVAEAVGAERLVQGDYRWLALKRPHSRAGQDAQEKLVSLSVPLSPAEQTERLVSLAEADALSQLEAEFAELSPGKLGASRYAEVRRARAFALFRARESQKAVLAFDELARFESERATEYGYYAARSLARQNLDSEALERFVTLARGRGAFADHAQYQLARLKWQTGQRETSIVELESYLRRYAKGGRNLARAAYDLAIFRLVARDGQGALTRLLPLRKQASDPKERARLDELLGVAYEFQNDPSRAEESFRSAIVSDPLSLAATLAAGRLTSLGLSPQQSLEPSQIGTEAATTADLPDAVRRLDQIGLSREAEDALYPLIRQEQNLDEARKKQAECYLFNQLERAERGYRVAQQNASARELRYAPVGPHRWHWECLFPRPHRSSVQFATADTTVPSALIYAVMRQESAFRSDVVSPAGAVGLMQLMPATATRVAALLDVNLDPAELRAPKINVHLGARYLAHLWDLFGQQKTQPNQNRDSEVAIKAPRDLGRLGLAVLAYNAGPHAVQRWVQLFGDLPIDLFFAAVPYEETRNYGYRVLSNLARYEVLEFGAVQSQLTSLETPKAEALPLGTF